jgi:hypothetical protein
MTTIISQP